MAQSKKYAGLLDLDQAPEIYETPDLTDDASTNQTATNRTISPSPSEDDDRHDTDTGLDRQHIDRDEARRRFEPSSVNAKDVNFSDSLASNRTSYKIKRRRRRIRENGVEELGDLTESDEEKLPNRLARLRREAEEIKRELERRKEGPAEPHEAEETEDVEQGIVKLSEMLDDLHTTTRSAKSIKPKVEAGSRRELASERVTTVSAGQEHAVQPSAPSALVSSSTTSAIASFSDRLSALEAALGLASSPSTTESTSILPTLTHLSTQITTLVTSLVSTTSASSHSGIINSTSSTQNHSTLPHLEALAAHLHSLAAESDKLTTSRKRALDSLHDLQEARMRDPQRYANAGSASDASREISKSIFDDSSAKITALYATLPTIQDLQPLLPVVLDRLRSLQGLHAGAATAKEDLDDLERRQAETSRDIDRWTKGLENVETKMNEWEKVMDENRNVVEKMVGEVEGRLGTFEPR